MPWASYPDLGVVVYFWETLKVRWVWGVAIPFGGVAGGNITDNTRLDVLFVQFDDHDRVQKYEILKHPNKTRTKDLATLWVRSK